jgi:uncharacterized protein YggE
LSIQPTYESARSGTARIIGFRASNQVTIKIHEIDKLAQVIDQMIAAGANEISGVRFAVSSPAQVLDETRAKAVEDARRKAEIYVRAAGASLGPVVHISEDEALPAPVLRAAPQAAAGVTIAPGEETLRARLTVTYELRR